MAGRKLLATLVAATVLLIAGVVQSDQPVKGNVTLMDFDGQTDVLLGYPDGTPPLGWYKRVQKTKYIPAVINNPQAPPNPCRIWTRVYNRVLARPLPPKAQAAVMRVIFTKLAQHQCRADINRDANSDPQVMNSIQPTP